MINHKGTETQRLHNKSADSSSLGFLHQLARETPQDFGDFFSFPRRATTARV
jgi:hypothetical protein